MASNAIRTQKTIIEYLSAAPSTYAKIGEVKSFDGPGGKAVIIDVTNFDSTKEKLPGLPDEGTYAMVCNYWGGDDGQQYLFAARIAQSLEQFRVTFTDNSTAIFSAFVMEAKISAKADSVVELALSLEITGQVTWDVTGVTAGALASSVRKQAAAKQGKAA